MTATRLFAMVFGVVFLLIGIAGFVHPLLQTPMPGPTDDVLHSFDGRLLGLFHVNAVHSAVHILFGVLGLALCGTVTRARLYGRIVAIAYGVLAIAGMIPAFYTLFGICPIHGNDIWLHVVLALVGLWYGFLKTPENMDINARTPIAS